MLAFHLLEFLEEKLWSAPIIEPQGVVDIGHRYRLLGDCFRGIPPRGNCRRDRLESYTAYDGSAELQLLTMLQTGGSSRTHSIISTFEIHMVQHGSTLPQ